MQRNAPARGAVGTRSVVVSAGSVASGDGARGSLIPHAGAIRALVIAMIEAPFGTAPMALARGADRRAAGRRATRRRAIRVAAITRRRRSRRADCSVDRLSGEAARPRRRSSGALRLDTARQTVAQERRLARSVEASRRSPRAWRVKLQAFTSIRRKPDSLQQSNDSRGRSAAAAPEHRCDHDGRRAPARLFDDR